MNKLPMLISAALAAEPVGNGALASSPPASPARRKTDCKSILWKAHFYDLMSQQFYAVGDDHLGAYYNGLSSGLSEAFVDADCPIVPSQ
jgi:hypothetical protein